MTKVAITKSLLDDLAVSISAKTGETLPLTIAEMTDAVDDIILPQGTKTITANGTGIDVADYAAVDVAVPQLDTSDANATASDIRSGKSGYVNGSKVSGSLTSRDSTSLSANGDTVTVPAGIYDAQATKSVTSGSATAPATISGTAATVSTGTNTLTLSKTVSVTPTVSAGYVSSGTAGNASVSLTASVNTRSSSDLTVSGDTVTAPAGYYASAASKSVASGTAGTPSATKGAVSNHSVTVTPSVTNTAGYISGGTKTGTGVTVSASELVSGSETKTANGTYDVTNLASLVVNVSGGSASFGTVTTTNSSNQNTTISFTLPSGRTPKAFFVRLTSQIARNSNSRYYYVYDMRWDGSSSGGVAGNTFYMSSGTLTNVTSGYSYSQDGTTFTLSSTGSRSASPGSFYNGTYEMVYVY